MTKLRRGCFVTQESSEEEEEEEEIATVTYNADIITSSMTRIAQEPCSQKRCLQAPAIPMEIDPIESHTMEKPMDVDEQSLPSASRVISFATPRYPVLMIEQGASAQMAPFIEAAPGIQETILSIEYVDGVGDPCVCDRGESLYRCLDCVQGSVSCGKCLVESHKNNPFHIVQKWVQDHFAKSSLDSLEFCLHLGHFGNPCPNAPDGPNGRQFTIVHVNGVHDMFIKFCHCISEKSEVDQLLQCRLFPATLDIPQTVFTFAFLDDFQIHNATSHKSMYDYYDAIRRKTDAAFPDKVTDRYREALRCNRIWAHLAVMRRTGQVHGIDSILAHRRKGCLAIRCVACPEPGFNLDPKTLKDALESERHKYTAFYSLDGNFRLQQALKNSDLDDVALNQGCAYFVPEDTYQQYLKVAKPKSDTDSTCAHLNAVRLQNIAKFKGARVSGVVSVQCARHAIFLPQGTVDLAKGEEYARSDFALVHALSEAILLRWLRCSYDLWCQYVINLLERIKTHFPSIYTTFKDKLDGAIPKMHVKNHLERCQYRWAFNFMPHSGETCGESIETTWAELNQAAATTKEMNAGHRHDSLDAAIGHWNWKKTQTIVKLLAKRYLNCKARLDEYERNFRAFSVEHATRIEQWSLMDTTFQTKTGGEWSSVYAVEYEANERPPTQRKAYDDLLEKEKKEHKNSKKRAPRETTRTELIQQGLQIEAEQVRLRKLVSDTPDGDVSVRAARGLLLRRIQSWRIIQRRLCSELATRIPEDTSEPEPEKSLLFLPSSFSAAEREKFKLKSIAKKEQALREGALERIRIAIQTFNHNCRITREEIFGQSPNTRAQAFLRTLKEDQYHDADVYRDNRKAFIKLCYTSDQDPEIAEDPLAPLNDKDLWGKNTSYAPQLGDSKLVDPWFWYVRPRNVEKAKKKVPWADRLNCTKWHRDRAILDRCKEEKEILIQEIHRTYKSFEQLASIWSALGTAKKGLAKTDTTGNQRGGACYAYKQAAMYTRFKDDTMSIIKQEFTVLKDGNWVVEPELKDICPE